MNSNFLDLNPKPEDRRIPKFEAVCQQLLAALRWYRAYLLDSNDGRYDDEFKLIDQLRTCIEIKLEPNVAPQGRVVPWTGLTVHDGDAPLPVSPPPEATDE